MKQAIQPFIRCFFCYAVLMLSAVAPSDVWAQTTLVQWNFNGSNTVPSTGTGSLALIGGTTATFASGNAGTGSTDPESTNADQAWNITAFAAQGTGNKTRGIDIQVNTTQFQSLSISWDQRFSNSAGNRARLQYSTDGVTFTDAPFSVTANPGDAWYNNNSYDFSAISGLNNNPNTRFRIVSEFSTTVPGSYTSATLATGYNTTGTWRFDMLTVRGVAIVPQPTLAVNPASLTSFTATPGTASNTQTYTLTGSDLTSNVLVSASTGAEISTDGTSFSSVATFTPTSGTISQPLFARLSATAPTGAFSGTVTHTSSSTLTANLTLSGTVSSPSAGRIEITEYMYNGSEYIELTNVGSAPVDMTGWSFDDSSRQPDSFPIGSVGTVAPGESVIISEASAAAFRTNWFLPASVKVVGGNNNNLGGSDEINIYDSNDNLVDQLTYSSGGNVTANGVSAYPTVSNLSSTTAAAWQLSVVGDAQNTYVSADGNTGNPGGYTVPLNRVLVRETLNSTTVVEGGATDTYTVALNSAPSADVALMINVPGSPLSVNPTALVFTPTNYSTAQTVTVSATDDATVQGTRSLTITQSATSADVAYNGISVNPVVVHVSDPPAAQPVSISATNNGPFVNTPTTGPAFVSGVVNDPTDPASMVGLNFILSAASDLTVTAISSNTSVVANANLVLTGVGVNRNLKITPTGVGYATITISASSSSAIGTYIINYAASAASVAATNSRYHTGTSDASTAIAIDANYMLVADDEDQTIRLYDRTKSGLPLASFNVASSLGLSGNGEVDIEASTRTGNTIYWIGSHAEGGSSNRQRIFSTTVNGSGAATTLTFGGYYSSLRTDLVNWDNSNGHGLGAGYLGLAGSTTAGVDPETPTGFNIEGFTLAPDGTTGYLGFRAPLQPTAGRTKALIIPITNLSALVTGTPASSPATFGAPIFLDLGGRSIRSIERNANNEYLIIGGPIGASTTFALYTWTGNPADVPVLRSADLTALNTGGSFETIVDVPLGLTDTTPIQLVTDNGSTVWYTDGTASKDLAQDNFQKFRSDVVLLGAAIPTTPDLTPILYARPSLVYGNSLFNVVVDVVETNGISSSGPITVKVTRDARLTLSLDASLTNIDGRAVQNSNWSFSSDANYYILTTSQTVTGGDKLSFGLTGQLTTGSTTGVINCSATLIGGSEGRVNNNTDADKTEYFQQ
ncbi:lamin tail domain-containing protein [Spirosoma validum]|uniref:Lamin tail domain-containing protein n=1 Tax=Spirosoma validum TaxID=2771355 RepID=A0A927AZJ6_9BACT|nr:lamin tail domain-containing protein [Spirosoma validum]MBD2752532.1 lamin tail domain-containing protein [Spirosoma validum]